MYRTLNTNTYVIKLSLEIDSKIIKIITDQHVDIKYIK